MSINPPTRSFSIIEISRNIFSIEKFIQLECQDLQQKQKKYEKIQLDNFLINFSLTQCNASIKLHSLTKLTRHSYTVYDCFDIAL